jgi:hypothetical protein
MSPKNILASQRNFSRAGAKHSEMELSPQRKKVRVGAVRSALQRLLYPYFAPYVACRAQFGMLARAKAGGWSGTSGRAIAGRDIVRPRPFEKGQLRTASPETARKANINGSRSNRRDIPVAKSLHEKGRATIKTQTKNSGRTA